MKELELLCFVLDLNVSKTLRLAVDELIKANREQMEQVRPLFDAAQGALAQARQSLESTNES